MKKGDIWISAVLYIALGIIIITIILSAVVPLIEKLRDRNTFIQTKELLYAIDDNIKTVSTEGTGSKRFLSPLNIDKGELIIDENTNEIIWQLKTKYKAMESNIDFNEGSLILASKETNVKDEYLLSIKLKYENIAILNLESEYDNSLTGTYTMLIEHTGAYSNDIPVIKLTIK